MLSVVIVALTFGSLGCWLALLGVTQWSFDWGNFLGLAVTAVAAAIAASFGFRDYLRRQERDDVARSWRDEGFARVGRMIAADYERELSNWTACDQLVQAAAGGVPRETLELMAAQIDRTTPTLTFDHRRLLILLDDARLWRAYGLAYGYLRSAHVTFSIAVPAGALALHGVSPDHRDEVVSDLQQHVETAVRRLEEALPPVIDHHTRLAIAFERLHFKSHAEAQRAREDLTIQRDAFARAMEPVLENARNLGLVPPEA